MLKIIKKFINKLEDFVIFIITKTIKTFKRYRKSNSVFKVLLYRTFIVIIGLFMLSAGFFMIWFSTLKTPDINVFDDKLLGQSAKIYDRTGTVLLYDLSQKVRRSVVPLDQISPYIKNATIAIEDNNFYNHSGIKITSLFRAVLANITQGGYSQGGSTITQQVVKNSLLTKDKTLVRKIKEIFLSLKLEKNLTKDQILTLYLNNSPYGGNIYGVEEATQLFFNKKASDVTLAESAIIASLPKAPSTYNPYGGNKQILLDRKNQVLANMFKLKMITQEEYETAKNETLVFQPRNLGSIKAAHFVMYLKEQLEKKYGVEKLTTGGFKIISTIDYDLQKKGEDIVYDYVKSNQKKFNADNGSVVVIDPKTGQILSMIGSRDYFDTDIDGNFNIATAYRQPGSAFKPFVYATAFAKGFLPQTVLFDTPTEFSSECSPNSVPKTPETICYNPQNYEGGFKGPMTLRMALGASRNIPAVKLLYLVGVQPVINTAKSLGISNLDNASKYGLSLALGSAEVSVLDMTSAYGVFANDGIKNNVTGILKIEDMDGNMIEEYTPSPKKVLDSQVARLINDVLSDVVARNSIFVKNYFKSDTVAMKTGTTNNSRDAWTIGYTPTVVVGAWIGNNNNKPMNQIASALIVSPMWKQYMDYILTKVNKEDFTKPEEASSDTKPFLRGIYQDAEGVAHSELYWIDLDDITGPAPTNPAKNPLFYNFENSIYGGGLSNTDPNNTNSQLLKISILGGGMSILKNSSLNLTVSGYDINTKQIDFFVNNVKVGSSLTPPYSYNINLQSLNNINPENEIKIVEYKNDNTSKNTTSYFTIQE
jgi:1A family penicillin-binding protein